MSDAFLRNRFHVSEVNAVFPCLHLERTIQCNSWYAPISARYPEPSLKAMVLSPSEKRESSSRVTFTTIARGVGIHGIAIS